MPRYIDYHKKVNSFKQNKCWKRMKKLGYMDSDSIGAKICWINTFQSMPAY